MNTRTSESLVTFHRAFTLRGVDSPQPPGTYRVVVDEAEIHGLSFLAFQRTATMLHTPAVKTAGGAPGPGGATEVYEIDPDELAAVVAADAD